MAIYIKRKVNAQIYGASNEKDCLFAPDDKLAETIISTHTRFVAGRFLVAISGSEGLSFGDVTTARGIYVKFDANAQLVLNGGAQTLNVEPETSSVANGVFMMTGDLSSATVTNPSSTSSLTGQYVVWGD